MARWLLKTEPEDYSWDRLIVDGRTRWTGVRNHQAAANLRAMRSGDRAFFYRSMVEPAILGIMTVVQEAVPDPTEESGRWVCVEMAPEVRLPREVSLKEIRPDPRLADFALVRQSRLSVMPVNDAHWAILCAMAGIEP